MAEKTGACMCGAVRFTARDVLRQYGACHCEMCRRWAGGTYFGFRVDAAAIDWTGEVQIRTIQSSTWAERAWCGRCGSALYYRPVGDDAPDAGTLTVSLGLLDDIADMRPSVELFSDCRAPGLTLDVDGPRMTRAEVFQQFGIPEGSDG